MSRFATLICALVAAAVAACTWGPAPPATPGPLPPPPVAPSILPPRAQTTEVLPPEPVAPPTAQARPTAPTAVVAPLPAASAVRPPPVPPARLPLTDDNGAVIAGQDGFQAQRAAKELACEVSGQPALVDKGPGFESYEIRCADGRTLNFRCSLGDCRLRR